MMISLGILVLVSFVAWIASVAFSRLSGRSAVAAMGMALVLVVGLAFFVFLVFAALTRQLD
jgi:hypothetical protein